MMALSKSNNWTDEDYFNARRRMVEQQLAGRDVKNEAVLETMGRIPRHLFVPDNLRHEAYDDCPLPIGCGQTISQPYIVASMTEYLNPLKSKSVLEVGTGSGYQTAVLSELFDHIVTVEYYSDLSDQAGAVLTRLGYINIDFHVGDVLEYSLKESSFDAIIVTAAPEKIPDKLISLLAPGGRMVVPVGIGIQDLKLVLKKDDESFKIQSLYPVRFVPLQR